MEDLRYIAPKWYLSKEGRKVRTTNGAPGSGVPLRAGEPIAHLPVGGPVGGALVVVDCDLLAVGEHLVAVDHAVLPAVVAARVRALLPVSGEPPTRER